MFQPSRTIRALLAVLALLLWASNARAETIARCGKGWLERIDGMLVLHVAGTPYEMGYQHGVLLKDHATQNMNYMLEEKAKDLEYDVLGFKFGPTQMLGMIVDLQRKHLPAWYTEELRGLAEGTGLPLAKITRGNFIPEMFHCSGFAVMNSATADGTLYHGRVLDYAVDWKLQEHAVLVVSQPDQGIPSVNVTFAGFLGSVTGMNAEHVSVGEMGGGGLGHWDGVPMSVLVRWALQEAKTLDEAVAIFRDKPRTCQYFYVVADGKTNQAIAFEASWNKFDAVKPGTAHALLPRAVKDAVLLSAGDRYNCLVDRVESQHGKLDAASALKLMDPGVAMKSNLHNVLFAPKSTQFWVSYAAPDQTPASRRPYQAFQLSELLKRKPDDKASETK